MLFLNVAATFPDADRKDRYPTSMPTRPSQSVKFTYAADINNRSTFNIIWIFIAIPFNYDFKPLTIGLTRACQF